MKCTCLRGKDMDYPSYMSEMKLFINMKYTCEACSVRDEITGEF